MEASVILPTYNEKENIPLLITEILKFCPDVEVIVVDDDSPDKTWQVAEDIAKNDKRVSVIRRIGRRGLVSAIVEGIASSGKEAVAWMDADFSMPPGVIPALLDNLKDNDIAVGSRYVKGAKDSRNTLIRVLASRVLNGFASIVLGTRVKDLTSGFIAARKDIFKDLSLSGSYGDYAIKLMYEAEKKMYRIKEVPYECMPRFKGQTKTDPDIFSFLSLGIGYISMIFKLRFSPIEKL